MFNRLANEHPIERVSVERRQCVEMNDGRFIQRQGHYPVPLPICHNEMIEGSGKRQSTEDMFD
jgi:hypothetical protein